MFSAVSLGGQQLLMVGNFTMIQTSIKVVRVYTCMNNLFDLFSLLVKELAMILNLWKGTVGMIFGSLVAGRWQIVYVNKNSFFIVLNCVKD